MKLYSGRIQIKKLILIKIIWIFLIINCNQVRGFSCPANYVCADSSSFFIWTGLRSTIGDAEILCDNLGLLVLRLVNTDHPNEELLQPNLTQVITENTSVWLGVRYDYPTKSYRWLDTNEVYNFNQRNSNDGDCLVVKDSMTRIVSVHCKAINHIVCMGPKNNWFGSNQQFMCHCLSKECYKTGACHNTDGNCALGWFGERCQLRDALLDVKNKFEDFNRASCTQQSEVASILVSPPAYFSWIRIVSQGIVGKDTFSVALTTHDQTIVCPGARSFIIADDTVDIACCTELTLVSHVWVKWQGVRTLCSVHMYRGQNVASQGISTVSSGSLIYGALFAVDGYRGIVSPNLSSSLTQALDSWSLEFNIERIVFEVIIYVKHAQEEDVNISLEFKSSLNTTVQRNNAGVSTFRKGTYKLRLLSGTKEKVKHVKANFLSSSSSLDNKLDLSEVEVYGACIPPSYSASCDVSCDPETETDLCHYDGECDITRAARMTSARTKLITTNTAAGKKKFASTPLYDDPKKKTDKRKDITYLLLLIPVIGITLIICYKLRERNFHQEDTSKTIVAEDRESSKNKELESSLNTNSEHSAQEGSTVDIESPHASEYSKHSSGIYPVGTMQAFAENGEGTKKKESIKLSVTTIDY